MLSYVTMRYMNQSRTIETGTTDILGSVRDGVGLIVLNRPESRNAMTADMMTGLTALLTEMEDAQDVGAVGDLVPDADRNHSNIEAAPLQAFTKDEHVPGVPVDVHLLRIQVHERDHAATCRISGKSAPI